MTTVKTGPQHIASLRDNREVLYRGKRVADVTTHAAFRNSVASSGHLYDFQARPEKLELMTFESPDKPGTRVNRCWQLPTSYAELVERRRALEAWSETHCGMIGRSPDHVASCISGMAMGIDALEGSGVRTGVLQDYYRYARDNDLFLTYVIINPQADRSKGAAGQADPFLTAGVVDEDAGGLTIRGAKMLGTSAIMANEVLVTSLQPLKKGEDDKYAVSFMLPMNAPGLKVMSRKSYEEAAPNVFDNPLASRFDENDAVLYFDDVKVPWDRIFVNQDTDACARQFHGTPAHIYQNYQAQIRLAVKLRFMTAVARRIAEINGILAFPPVRDTLGQLAAEAAMVDGLLHGMEAKGTQRGPYFVPDAHILYSAQVLTQQLYAKVLNTLRELAGGGMIMLPSGVEDFSDPALRALIDKTQRSPATDPEGRVKFFKLAWDAVGSEFASRHAQYEMFYAGASFVTRGHSFRTYDWDRGARMLDGVLDSYDLEGARPAPGLAAE
jgi:4-hydroxyphenylacetate 3-monooxygenase